MIWVLPLYDCDQISGNVMPCAVPQKLFSDTLHPWWPTYPIVRVHSPASVYRESRIAAKLEQSTSSSTAPEIFCTKWEAETPIRGAEPCGQKSELGPGGVRAYKA